MVSVGRDMDARSASNMIYFDLAERITLTENQIIEEMKKYGVLVDWAGPRRFRFVTHYWVDDEGVEKAVKGFSEILK